MRSKDKSPVVSPLRPPARHPPSLSDFIIAAIEEAAPGLDGEKIYMRGFERFIEYCAAQHRKAAGIPERRRISRLTLMRE